MRLWRISTRSTEGARKDFTFFRISQVKGQGKYIGMRVGFGVLSWSFVDLFYVVFFGAVNISAPFL